MHFRIYFAEKVNFPVKLLDSRKVDSGKGEQM